MSSYPLNGWMPDELPHLPTYQQAHSYYEKVAPYAKGSEAGYRPLGAKRRYTRSLILAEANTIMFSYYNNIVARLHADGRREFDICNYPTISTLCVLNETSRTDNLIFKREKGKIYAVYKNTFYRMPNRGAVEISPDGAITGYEIETQHSIRHDAMKAKREKYTAFLTFIDDMLTISPYVDKQPSTAELDGNFVSTLNQIYYMPSLKSLALTERKVDSSMQNFFDLLDEALGLDEDERLKRFFHLANKLLCSVLMEGGGHNAGMRIATFDSAKHHFYELIKYRFNKEVFAKTEVAPRDRPVHDSNKHYTALVF